VFGRLIGGWLMDGMEGAARSLGFCCYFLGSFLRFAFRQKRCGSLQRRDFYGKGFGWTFICLNTSPVTTTDRRFSKVSE